MVLAASEGGSIASRNEIQNSGDGVAGRLAHNMSSRDRHDSLSTLQCTTFGTESRDQESYGGDALSYSECRGEVPWIDDLFSYFMGASTWDAAFDEVDVDSWQHYDLQCSPMIKREQTYSTCGDEASWDTDDPPCSSTNGGRFVRNEQIMPSFSIEINQDSAPDTARSIVDTFPEAVGKMKLEREHASARENESRARKYDFIEMAPPNDEMSGQERMSSSRHCTYFKTRLGLRDQASRKSSPAYSRTPVSSTHEANTSSSIHQRRTKTSGRNALIPPSSGRPSQDADTTTIRRSSETGFMTSKSSFKSVKKYPSLSGDNKNLHSDESVRASTGEESCQERSQSDETTIPAQNKDVSVVVETEEAKRLLTRLALSLGKPVRLTPIRFAPSSERRSMESALSSARSYVLFTTDDKIVARTMKSLVTPLHLRPIVTHRRDDDAIAPQLALARASSKRDGQERPITKMMMKPVQIKPLSFHVLGKLVGDRAEKSKVLSYFGSRVEMSPIAFPVRPKKGALSTD